MKLKVKNWETFQHYKGRKPPWIKLHRDLLDNYQFFLLPVESRALAPMLWLIASENLDGSISLDSEALAFRLHMSSGALALALKPLIERGFFVPDADASAMLARCLQHACPEAEAEAERETEREAEAAAEQRQSALPAPPAAAASSNKNHSSAFAFAEVEQFVAETKLHIRNPGGLATRLCRTGEEDAAIKLWKEKKAMPKEENWPKWVFDPKEPGTVEEKKRLHLQLCEAQRRAEAEALAFNQQPAASDEAA